MTDAQWRRLEPHLPPLKPRTGRPNEDHRRILNGILWVLRTGAPWRDLPRRYGPTGTVSSRFYRWRASGMWDRVLSALQAEADARGGVDWDLYRERNVVERLVGRLKEYRRIATRYDKLAASYLAFVQLAAIRMWL